MVTKKTMDELIKDIFNYVPKNTFIDFIFGADGFSDFFFWVDGRLNA